MNQLYVSHLISSNWVAIRQRLRRSQISEFDARIALRGPGRAITGVDFEGVARRRVEILGSYGRYVKTDVARFYPSIYTHAIPWALLGKDYVKKNHRDPAFKASFANQLDKAVSSGQEGQTVGIPIGPDTSRILSELIAVEVEEIARARIIDFDHRSVRYVDDMLIGINDAETPSAVLSGLSLALYDYELEINAEKTVTHGMGCPHAPEWINYIRTFVPHTRVTRQLEDLNSYFEQAIYLADANPRENVLLFASKRAASFELHPSNQSNLIRWLLYAARRSPSCLSFVAEHLAASQSKLAAQRDEIESYILQQLPTKAEAAHTHELAWLLFWSREIGLKLPSELFEKVTTLRSSVVALLTLDLRQRGQIVGNIKVPLWRKYANADGLKSEMWLVAYEATVKGWWRGKASNAFITGHKFFGDIAKKQIELYDVARKARPHVPRTYPKMFLKTHMGSGFGFGGGGYPD